MTRSSKAALLLQEALSLPETERLDLAAALIESVEKERAREDVRAAWASAAKRRVAEVRLGVVKPVPWDDAEKRIFDTE
jgi:putative addiction module component (TIGR02574 family)